MNTRVANDDAVTDLSARFDALDKLCFVNVGTLVHMVESYRALVERDDSGWAYFMCGYCTYQKDVSESMTYFAKAIPKLDVARKNGDPRGYYGMAYCSDGPRKHPVPYVSNKSLALDYYKIASKLGFFLAQSIVASIYDKGTFGVKQNHHLAAHYYGLASEQGFAPAQRRLGAMYDYGQGVCQDLAETARLYELAIAQGCIMPSILKKLSVIYYHGANCTSNTPNYPRAAKLAKIAAENGDDNRWLQLVLDSGVDFDGEEPACY